MPNQKKSNTIRDVARQAGVSYQTVSRVINKSKLVLPETREKVEIVIKEIGFRPSAIARSMAVGRTNTIACISPNITDYTFASIIEGAEKEARKEGYFLLSSSAENPNSFISLIDELAGHHRVDGLIIINPYADRRFEAIPEDFPLVFVGACSRDKKICSVSLDDKSVGYEATRHLISLGHQEIGMITGPKMEDCCTDRTLGYSIALKEANLSFNTSLIIEGNWSASSGQAALFKFANLEKLPSAVFAQNDRMALGVLSAAREKRLEVPEQLAVIGVDDMPLASYFDPPLTTMHQNMPEIGSEAVRMLMKSMKKTIKKCIQLKLPAQLVIRQSTSREGGGRENYK